MSCELQAAIKIMFNAQYPNECKRQTLITTNNKWQPV